MSPLISSLFCLKELRPPIVVLLSLDSRFSAHALRFYVRCLECCSARAFSHPSVRSAIALRSSMLFRGASFLVDADLRILAPGRIILAIVSLSSALDHALSNYVNISLKIVLLIVI